MPIARERVVPPPPRHAWLKFSALAGLVGVGIGFAVAPATNLVTQRASLASVNLAYFYLCMCAVVFSLLLGPLAYLFRVTQRWSICLAFSTTLITSVALTAELSHILSRGDGGANIASWSDADEAIGIAILFVSYMALASILRLAYRLLLIRTIEHSAALCPWCGYTLGAPSIVRCPECGHDSSPARFRSHGSIMFTMALARRWRLCLLLTLATLALVAAHPVIYKTIPSARFYTAFPSAERTDRFSPTAYIIPDLPTVWLPHPARSDRGLRITYELSPPDRPARMIIDITGTPATSFSYGAGHIISHLSPAQAARVIARGLPDPLIQALYAKAEEIAWTPNSVARGAWEVDAAPFFPKE